MTEKIYKAQNRAFSLLEEKGVDSGSVRLLLQHITGFSHAALLANLQSELTEIESKQFWQQIDELAEGKPIQYVIGYESFYGRIFTVDEHVLIPRPETEELVYGALERKKRLFKNQDLKCADIGTGSGAIAVTMKLECPTLHVTATDISRDALNIAEKNATDLQAEIQFRQGDLAEPLANEKWDIILSNPPYIGQDEVAEMTASVFTHEPHLALFADEDGLACYRKLANELPSIMKIPGLIGLEIGYLQGEAVKALFHEAFPDAVIDIVQDINGKDRMIFCELNE